MIAGLAATLSAACLGDAEPSDVVQIFTPRSEVRIAFSARAPGEALDRVSLEWGAVGEPPTGFVYQAWLISDDGERLTLERFRVLVDTTLVPADTGSDMLATYSQFEITLEPRTGDDPSPSLEMATHRATVEQDARELLRSLLSDANDTPPATGYAAGLVRQASSLQTQATLAANAAPADIIEARRRLEHALNIIDGTAVDHNGDGTVDNAASDGFGLLNYASRTAAFDDLVATIANPWNGLLLSGDDLALIGDSLVARIADASLVAQAGVQSSDPAVVSDRADTLLLWAELILGVENALVDPACSGCGALTAWQRATDMTWIPLTAQQPFVF